MSFKDKILDIFISNPKLVIYSIGLTIAFEIGTIGIITDSQRALINKPIEWSSNEILKYKIIYCKIYNAFSKIYKIPICLYWII